MKVKQYLIFLLFLFSVFSAENNAFADIVSNQTLTIEKVMTARPYDDFSAAKQKNDLRFVGVASYVVTFPGLQDRNLIKKYSYKFINGTTEGCISYEMGKSNLIARYYAEKYNGYLEDYINTLQAFDLLQSLPGYENISNNFIIIDANTGEFNFLPQSLCIKLLAKNKIHNVSAARWFNPLTNKYPKYTWTDFLEIYREAQRITSKHKWLKNWSGYHTNRYISIDIFGKRPYTESLFDFYPRSAWHHAKLSGEPYYELDFMENGKPRGTMFLGKQSRDAIITDMSTNKINRTHWLDNFEILYHPKDSVPEYIIVHNNGMWYTNISKKIQLEKSR